MRTVLAVTAPLDAVVPTALTQSFTASADAVVVCVWDTVVVLEVVALNFSTFNFGALALFLALDLEDFEVDGLAI
jgi:hypothetical protein